MFTQVNKWKINILSRSRLLCTTYLCVGGCCNLHNNVIVPDHFLWWMWVVTIHHLFSVFIIIQQRRGSKNTIQWNVRILFFLNKWIEFQFLQYAGISCFVLLFSIYLNNNQIQMSYFLGSNHLDLDLRP